MPFIRAVINNTEKCSTNVEIIQNKCRGDRFACLLIRLLAPLIDESDNHVTNIVQ